MSENLRTCFGDHGVGTYSDLEGRRGRRVPRSIESEESGVDVRVREQALPGIGMRYEIEVGEGRQLFVIAYRDGRREIGVTGHGDTPDARAGLDQEAAVTVAALLLGARFTVDTREGAWVSSDEVVVDVVELGEVSPAVGKSQAELDLADPEAVVLAVTSDTTPELIESETDYRCQVGDRVVVAARASRIDQVAAALHGPAGGTS